MQPDSLDDWLAAANERFAEVGVEHKARPFRAISEYATEFRAHVVFGSPLANAIFEFFVKNGPPGAHAMRALFTTAFYFDSHFWPLHIPIAFGQHRSDPFESLEGMPPRRCAVCSSAMLITRGSCCTGRKRTTTPTG